MRRFLAFFLGISVFLTACASDNVEVKRKQYTATFLDLFDTVTNITGYADSEEEFHEKAQEILTAYRSQLTAISEYLLANETMSGEVFESYFTPQNAE